MFSLTISLGDVLVVGGMLAHLVFFQFKQVRRIDTIEYQVEELRKGRGLIMEHFPPMVRRCFGYGANGHHD